MEPYERMNEDAFERAAAQQAAMQQEEQQLREDTAYGPCGEGREEAIPYQAPVRGSEPSYREEATPYQTPVRGSEEPYRRGTYYEQRGHEGPSVRDQWHSQQAPYSQKKQTVRHRRRVLLAVGGVAAAVLLFLGGAGVGALLSIPDGKAVEPSPAPIEEPQKPAATVQIAEMPNISGDLSSYGLPGDMIYEKVDPSVVSIMASSLTSSGASLGSGIVMSEDGYIITNNHVVEGMDKFTVTLSDGSEMSATLIAGDADTDVAVIRAEVGSRRLTVPEFGDSDALKPGETCYAIGTPTVLRLTNSITTGSISAINRDITLNDKVMTLIQTDAAINSGNSGGALVNKYGQVVGITNAKLSNSVYSSSASYEGLGFAIPINTAKEVIDELLTHGYVAGRPSIGISGSNITEATARYNEVPQGVLVQVIDSRSKAAAGGLQVRDIITGVNGKSITTMDEINKIKEQFKAGDTLTLTVYRMSTDETLDVTIELCDTHDLEGADPATSRADSVTNNGRGSGYDSYGGYGGYYSFPFGSFFGGW